MEAGLGIALMPRSSVREELRIGSLRAIELERLRAEMPVFVVRRRGGYPSRLATAFLKILGRTTPDLSR